MLAAKLLLAPFFIAAASMAGRRWGPAAAGLASSLPVVGGPVLLIVGIEQGPAFESAAARAATAGLISLAGFAVVHARIANLTVRWWPPLLAGWVAFTTSTAVVGILRAGAGTWFAAAIIACAGGRQLVHTAPAVEPVSPSAVNLLTRMIAGAAMVLALTSLASVFGSTLTGLLAPFPVIASILAVATALEGGGVAVSAYARALLTGLPSFALFNVTLAVASPRLGVTATFPIAVFVVTVSHLLLMTVRTRTRTGRRRQDRPSTGPSDAVRLSPCGRGQAPECDNSTRRAELALHPDA